MRRGNKLFQVALGLILMGVVAAYLLIIAREDAPVSLPAVAAVVPGPDLAALIESATGTVEVRGNGSDWTLAQAGSRVAAGGDVGAQKGARAALAYGDAVRIEISDDAEVKVAELNDKLARLVVGRGFVFADVREGAGRRLQLTSQDGKAVAETAGGAMTVASEADGKFRAAVARGEGTLTAQGKSVALTPGFFSVVAKGERPSEPTKVPRTLLLKVKWPDAQTTAKRRQAVSGTAMPGTRVRVGDAQLWADEKGRFETIVNLREGKNRIRVQAVDIVGRAREDASPAIELDTTLPKPAIETSPDMWKTSE